MQEPTNPANQSAMVPGSSSDEEALQSSSRFNGVDMDESIQSNLPVVPAPPLAPLLLPPPPVTSWRSRILLLAILVLTVALSLGGILSVHLASQASLFRAYPRPRVSIALVSTGPFHEGKAIRFRANGQGRDLTYVWDFGDGGASSGQEVSHAYDNFGPFTVRVIVADPIGQSNADALSLTIQTIPPVAAFDVIAVSGTFYAVEFDASASTSDSNVPIVNYLWDFGDGTSDATASPFDSHTYSGGGPYTVTLIVVDSSAQNSAPVSQRVTPLK